MNLDDSPVIFHGQRVRPVALSGLGKRLRKRYPGKFKKHPVLVVVCTGRYHNDGMALVRLVGGRWCKWVYFDELATVRK